MKLHITKLAFPCLNKTHRKSIQEETHTTYDTFFFLEFWNCYLKS